MSKTYTLNQLAALLDARVEGDGEIVVSNVATLEHATQQDVTFLSNSKYRKFLKDSQAAAVLLTEQDLEYCDSAALVHDNPYVAFARLAQLLNETPPVATGIASSANIATTAQLADSVAVGENTVIGAGVELGENVQVGAGCVIDTGVKIGANSRIYPNVTIYRQCEIGQSVVIQSNSVIGSDGFGYANDKGTWVKIPQTGIVVIGDNTEIGASVCIDRGALENTVIGPNVIIDNQVQIGHNVQVGEGSCLCGQVGIAGSAKLGKYVVVGGGAGINGHITICDQVQITGFSMITRDIREPGIYSSGTPATTNKEWRKNTVRLRQLESFYDRVKALEEKLGQ